MSIANRKLKEKQDMHKLILDAARKDKSEIFHELYKEGFRLLLLQLKVSEKVRDPFERLKSAGLGFTRFARDNKDHYNLMFIVDEPLKESLPFQIAEEIINYKKARLKNVSTTANLKAWIRIILPF